MDRELELDIPIVWERVMHVRRQVADTLADQPEEIRSASVIAASELVENAIKYGVSVPSLSCGRFSFSMTEEGVEVRVANGLRDEESLQRLQTIIDETASDEGARQGYESRLLELMDSPLQSNRLGLYRIRHEAKFRLSYTHEEGVLTMIARRPT